ncbi:MAG: M15 family metallopeptidase [Clostridia bacterium]|nr:M15 family metallopeptidase [Clostridia bacterium]
MSINKIPSLKMPTDDSFRYEAVDEPFVDILEYSNNRIRVQMKYAEQNRQGATTEALVRKSVADRLLLACELLPQGYTFKIFDAWRPYEVQKSLYDEYFERLKKENPHMNDESLHKLSREFVSYPDNSQLFSYVHSSGGAIDLTVVDGNNVELDMGTDFDDFSALANTDAFEKTDNNTVKENRRILYFAMTGAGFTNFPNEWWHYDYGDIFYSKITKEAVKYASVYSTEQIKVEVKR